jgi:hypothetical protein
MMRVAKLLAGGFAQHQGLAGATADGLIAFVIRFSHGTPDFVLENAADRKFLDI